MRRGPGVGKETLHGVVVHGKESAMKDELREVFGKMRGHEGELLRQRAKELMEGVMTTTRAPGGMSFEALKQLATAFRNPSIRTLRSI